MEVAKSLWLVIALIRRAGMIVWVWILGELSAVGGRATPVMKLFPGLQSHKTAEASPRTGLRWSW